MIRETSLRKSRSLNNDATVHCDLLLVARHALPVINTFPWRKYTPWGVPKKIPLEKIDE